MLNALKSRVLRQFAVRGNVTVGVGFHAGPRTVIWAPEHLEIGRDVYIGKTVTVEVDGRIGDGTMIANNVGIIGRSDHDIHQVGTPIRWSRWVGEHPSLSQPVWIGADVWIGFGSTVLSGVAIGDSAVVGAGSVVTHSIPPNSIAVGVPARVVGARFNPEELRDHWLQLRQAGYQLEESSHVY